MLEILAAILFALTIAWQWLTGGSEVPYTGRNQIVAVSHEDAAAMGAQAFEEVLQRHRVVGGGPQAALVDDVSERLIASAEDFLAVDYDWRVALLEDPSVNAFALPGGYVAVLSGLLPVAANADGLAAVIGHEIAHVIARHGAERVTHQRMADLGRLAVGVALGDMDPATRGAILGALGMGTQFGILMPFSRTHEAEADRIGLMIMARACFDPREAPALWTRMARAAQGGPPEFLSTHPAHGSRIEALQGWMEEALAARADADCPPLAA